MISFFIFVTFHQGIFDQLENILLNVDFLHYFTKLLFYLFLSNIGVPALTFVVGATVIDIFAFLLLTGYCASTDSAGKESSERQFPLSVSWFVMILESSLNCIEKLFCYNRSMSPFIEFSSPFEPAVVYRILQHAINGTLSKFTTAPGPETLLVHRIR
ncbi:MAG: hypothetical protein MUO91_05510 [candidate division Zixibacteria bacterium]|nr:hypothetical protein [candidate division Zixibacteria bacterium]